jgi:hypothetical protein
MGRLMLIERDVLISEDFACRFADNLLLVLSLAAINDLGDVIPLSILVEGIVIGLDVKELLPCCRSLWFLALHAPRRYR